MAEDREESRTHVWCAGFDRLGHFYTTFYSFKLVELNLEMLEAADHQAPGLGGKEGATQRNAGLSLCEGVN